MTTIYLYQLLITASWLQTVHSYCTTACMHRFHRTIIDVTGSSDKITQLAPFHYVIASADDNHHAHRKIRLLCSGVKNWENCVRACTQDDARTILLSSMGQWKKFCTLMRHPSKGINEFINCEREHQLYISQNCQFVNADTFSVAHFCSSMETYQRCVAKFVPRCSDEASKIKQMIDASVENSFEKLLKHLANRIKVPHKCNFWSRPKTLTREKILKEDPLPVFVHPTVTPVEPLFPYIARKEHVANGSEGEGRKELEDDEKEERDAFRLHDSSLPTSPPYEEPSPTLACNYTINANHPKCLKEKNRADADGFQKIQYSVEAFQSQTLDESLSASSLHLSSSLYFHICILLLYFNTACNSPN